MDHQQPAPNKGHILHYTIDKNECVITHTLDKHATIKKTTFEFCSNNNDHDSTGAMIDNDTVTPQGYLSVGFRRDEMAENIHEMVFRFHKPEVLKQFRSTIAKHIQPNEHGIFPLRLMSSEYV